MAPLPRNGTLMSPWVEDVELLGELSKDGK